MENQKICPHPFYLDSRIETQVLQELCNLGILDVRHAILCFPDSATVHIGYLDTKKMDPQHIPFFDGGYIEIYLYSDKNPVGYHKAISTMKEMELISLLYTNWAALVTVLLEPVAKNASPLIYEKSKENVEKWNQ